MSDSDSTWPATDDFGSRFLEIDVYENELPDERFSDNSGMLASPSVERRSRRSSRDVRSTHKVSSLRTNRGKQMRSLIALEQNNEDDDSDAKIKSSIHDGRPKRTRVPKQIDDSYHPDDLETFRSPKLLTARQMSLKMQRSTTKNQSGSERVKVEQELLSLESLEPVKKSSTPTPEQLAARQLSIARRRESAKHKAELEKRQTVERLLKVNTDSDSFQRRMKGKNRGMRISGGLSHSNSTASMQSSTGIAEEHDRGDSNDRPDGDDDEEEEADVELEDALVDEDVAGSDQGGMDPQPPDLAPRLTMGLQDDLIQAPRDPPTHCIRTISSSNLSPHGRLCFPPVSNISHPLLAPPVVGIPPSVPVPKLCALGCGYPRRYACAITGVSLCSLACYKLNLSNASSVTREPVLS